MRHNHQRFLIVVVMLFVIAGCGSSGNGKAEPPTTTAPTFTKTGPAPTTPTTTSKKVAAAAGAWSLIPDAPKSVGRPVAWTGTEVLVGGFGCCGEMPSADLAAYNPATNTWRSLPPSPLTHRRQAAGAWTGTEMIVSGGSASPDSDDSHAAPATDGAAWNAATNTWHPIAAMPTTLPGEDPTAVWTGREVLVWSSAASPGEGGREVVLAYNPSTDKWRSLPPSGLELRTNAVVVWTGKELVVWGGLSSDLRYPVEDGARLDPVTGKWRRIEESFVSPRGRAAAVWSGHEMLVWGGDAGGGVVGDGTAYDPATNRWRDLPASPLRAKVDAAGVWTGHSFVVIGGATEQGSGLPVPGPGAAAYDPSTNTWTALPAAPPYPAPAGPAFAADQRAEGLAVWTGKSVVLVGGNDRSTQANRVDGIKWTPVT
jgi:N-acetylneuraminic acid mutarotase